MADLYYQQGPAGFRRVNAHQQSRGNRIEHLTASTVVLAGLFFLVAFVHSTVGLGGGSSYTALLTLFGVQFTSIPTISLLMNIIVTSAGSLNFLRKHHGRFSLIAPFLITSLPLTYLGGSLRISRDIFYPILFLALLPIAYRVYFGQTVTPAWKIGFMLRLCLSLGAGAILGLLAGITGIGGGIFLVPVIILLELGSPREAAAAGSVFIWCNSVIGFVARLQHHPPAFGQLMPLAIAAAAGGWLGSFLGASKLDPGTLRKMLGAILLVAILFLGKELVTLW